MDNRNALEEAIFTNARQITGTAERERYVQDACGADIQLENRVRSLLRVYAEDASFLESPVETSAAMDLGYGVAETVGSIIGPYELIEHIGSGGMGQVFLAQQNSPIRRQVALKIIRTGMDTREIIRRFEAERQTLAHLNHPGITRLLDAGTTTTGHPWFVMELARGLPITAYCRQSSLSVSERLQMFEIVCDAVEHAHQNRVIHRDIKPANIVVTLVNGRPVPKVIDFGIARVVPLDADSDSDGPVPDQPELATIVGTPAYMSPEQTYLPGRELDARCDVYSLGIVLYELLTDASPFDDISWQDAGLTERRRAIQQMSPVPPSLRIRSRLGANCSGSTLATSPEGGDIDHGKNLLTLLEVQRLSACLRGDLDWITMKAIEKDRNRRYGSVADLAADIRRHLNHEPVEAGPPSSLYRVKKLFRRRKSSVVIVALTLGVLLLLSISAVIGRSLRLERSESLTHRQLVKEQQSRVAERDEDIRIHSYVSDTQAAFAAYLRGDLQQVRRLLQRHADSPEAASFEWQYLHRLSQDRARTLKGDHGKVFDVEFSPDGRLLVSCTGSGDCSLQIWDVASGSLVHSIRDFDNDVNSVCFSADGTLLLTGEESRQIRVWEVGTWREVGRLEGFQLPVGRIHLGADNRTVIATQVDWANRGATTTVRDLKSPEKETPLEYQRLLAVNEQQGIAAFVSNNSDISLRKLPGLDLVQRSLFDSTSASCGCLSSSGDMLVYGNFYGHVRIWRGFDAEGITLPTHGSHSTGIRDVSFSPDDRFVVAAADDGIVTVWDAATQVIQRVIDSTHGEAWSTGVAANGKYFAVGYQDGSIQIDEWEHVNSPRRSMIQSAVPFHAVAASARGTRIAIVDADRLTLTLYAADDGSRLQTISAPVDGKFTGVAFSSNDDSLWVTDDGGSLLQLDVRTTKVLRRLSTFAQPLLNPVVSTSGRYVAVNTVDSVVSSCMSGVWDLETESDGFQFPRTALGHPDGPRRIVQFLDDSVVLISQGTLLTRWNFKTGKEILPRFQEPRKQISHAALLPGNDGVVIGLIDWTIQLWTFAENQASLILHGHHQIPTHSAVSPIGQTLATASVSGEVRLWNMATGLPLMDLFGLTGETQGLWFAADGKRLFAAAKTASGGSEVMVWDASGP